MNRRADIDSGDKDRPLLICDVDEVALHFVAPFEIFLAERGLCLTKTSFALSGNIRHLETGDAIPNKAAHALVQSFHKDYIDQQPPVAGAADALEKLSAMYRIVFLSNIPEPLAERRQAHVSALGMPYPLLSNSGSKAEQIVALHRKANGTTVFIDDLPSHHSAVGQQGFDIQSIHFMADEILRKLAPVPSHVNRAADWQTIEELCLSYVTR